MSEEIKDLPDGLYFDLPEDEYHALPRLSASGIKDLRIHPTIFWAKSWMNPKKKRKETDAMKIGTAYHKRILEGKEAFDSQYAAKFTDDMAPEGTLDTADDLKAFIESHDKKPVGKKPVLIDMAKSLNPDVPILSELIFFYNKQHEGKQFLYQDIINDIEISAAFIEKNPDTQRCFVGGHSEVTVLWTEQDIKFKARLDYLKPRAVVDLKTFSNPMDKPIESAIYAAMASRKYYVPGAVYLRAAAKASEFAKTALDAWKSPDAIRTATEIKYKDFFTKLAETELHDFYFVFQLSGDVPIAECYKFPRQMMWSIGETIMNDAIRDFKHYHGIFGNEMWVAAKGIAELEDSKFPVYATEL